MERLAKQGNAQDKKAPFTARETLCPGRSSSSDSLYARVTSFFFSFSISFSFSCDIRSLWPPVLLLLTFSFHLVKQKMKFLLPKCINE